MTSVTSGAGDMEHAKLILYIASTAAMVLVLLQLACRCLREAGWWPRKLRNAAACEAETNDRFCPDRETCFFLFFIAILSQWLLLWIGFVLDGGEAGDFLSRVWERLTTAGDAPHYITLARNGYVSAGEDAKLIVFYPLYPAVLRFLTGFFGDDPQTVALCGMAVSQLCFGFAAVALVRLAGKHLPRGQALTVYAAWLIYPYVFFCSGVYTESLFMLLSLLTLYALEERSWLAAGVAGMLAALCRTQGTALIFPAVLCWLRQEKENRRDPKALFLLLIPLGLGIYLLCNRLVSGSWTAYLDYQSAPPWYNTPRWIGENLATQLETAAAAPWLTGFIYIPQIALYFIGLGCISLLLFRRKFLPAALYGTAYLGMSYLHGWMISGGRYMLGCFALFLAVGTVRSRWLRFLLLTAEFCGTVYIVYSFMQGQAIM